MNSIKNEHKVLILGCSFTQGSYTLDHNDSNREFIGSNIGWYDQLNCLKGETIDVYGCGGCGLMTYASILNQLDKNEKLKEYRTVVIQETSEPRAVFFQENHKWDISIGDNFSTERTLNITHYSTFAKYPYAVFSSHYFGIDEIFKHYNLNVTSDKYKLDLGLSPTLIDIVDQSKSHIKLLLEKHNITCYVFSLFEYHITDLFFQRIPLPPKLFDFINKQYANCLSGSQPKIKHITRHFSKRGNMILGNIVNNELSKIYVRN